MKLPKEIAKLENSPHKKDLIRQWKRLLREGKIMEEDERVEYQSY